MLYLRIFLINEFVNLLIKQKKILFIAHHRLDRSPGQRYRFEQYFSFLNENGISCELANIISEKDDQILYNSYNYLKKTIN